MLMAAGVDRLMTMDLHADQIQGYFEVPVDHLYASTVFFPEIQELSQNGIVVMAAPDVGGAKRANSYAKKLNLGLALCRSEEHTSELQSRPHLVCRLLLEKKKI